MTHSNVLMDLNSLSQDPTKCENTGGLNCNQIFCSACCSCNWGLLFLQPAVARTAVKFVPLSQRISNDFPLLAMNHARKAEMHLDPTSQGDLSVGILWLSIWIVSPTFSHGDIPSSLRKGQNSQPQMSIKVVYKAVALQVGGRPALRTTILMLMDYYTSSQHPIFSEDTFCTQMMKPFRVFENQFSHRMSGV